MFSSSALRWSWFAAAILVSDLSNSAVGQVKTAGQLKIYVVTDLEGISGVYRFAQTREPETPLNREAREYFMADVAAVVRGLRDAGATACKTSWSSPPTSARGTTPGKSSATSGGPARNTARAPTMWL